MSYDVKQLDALEDAIIKACQPKIVMVKNGIKNIKNTTDIGTDTCEKSEIFLGSGEHHNNFKETGRTELNRILVHQNGELETSCFEQTCVAEHDVKTTNITNLEIDPEVLKIYGTLV